MCWNAAISLNTFLFSSFVLALIIYNNAFTAYKIPELNNRWVYFFIASFVLMQLIEFFIWRNINNLFYNNVFSILASLLLAMQPAISIMILSNTQLRNILLTLYLLLAVPYSAYKFSTLYVYSEISRLHHLIWNFFDITPIIRGIWFFFLLFSLVYERKWFAVIFGLAALLVVYINYINDRSVWSMWCWGVNAAMIYYACYLLLYLPYLDNSGA